MIKNYVLNEKHELVEEPNLLKFAAWFENMDNRRVAEDYVGDYRVSTVFLGIGSFHELFETMIFDQSKTEKLKLIDKEHGFHPDVFMDRYPTWEDAMEGHKNAIQRAKDEDFE